MIDAESDYKGRYREAELYMRELRRLVGPDYPIGFTSFPYVHYHSTLPYSVFLGPGGADFNVPQMYWRAIGTSVDRDLPDHLHAQPDLQAADLPARTDLDAAVARPGGPRFRSLAAAYGATGVSWWSWQETTARDFTTSARRYRRLLAHRATPATRC